MDKTFSRSFRASERRHWYNDMADAVDKAAHLPLRRTSNQDVKDLALALHALADSLHYSAITGDPVTIAVLHQEPMFEPTDEGLTVIRADEEEE